MVNSSEETQRRLTLFMELDRNFQYQQSLTVGADHQLAGKYVAIDDAGANGGQKPSAAKDLDSVRVGSAKPQRDLQQLVVRSGRQAPDQRPLVEGSLRRLGAHHHVRLARLENGNRRVIEIQIAEIDLVAYHPLAAGHQDARLQGRTVIWSLGMKSAYSRIRL